MPSFNVPVMVIPAQRVISSGVGHPGTALCKPSIPESARLASPYRENSKSPIHDFAGPLQGDPAKLTVFFRARERRLGSSVVVELHCLANHRKLNINAFMDFASAHER